VSPGNNICLFNLFNLPDRCSDQDGSRDSDSDLYRGDGSVSNFGRCTDYPVL
jgi:hypothetical protein